MDEIKFLLPGNSTYWLVALPLLALLVVYSPILDTDNKPRDHSQMIRSPSEDQLVAV